jgi:class 3 adenylate cyclase
VESRVNESDYCGPALSRAAQLISVAHRGEVVVSQPTAGPVRDDLPKARSDKNVLEQADEGDS